MDHAGLSDAMHDRELMAAADEKAEKLLEELKEKVQSEISDSGTLRQELRVTVPAEVIQSHVEHNYEELRNDAQVPGFRKGHAPRRLIEKRFGADVRSSLKTAIIGQSYYAVIEKREIEVLGDPVFRIETDGGVKYVDLDEALSHYELPDEGDFSYTCEFEIKPNIELPELEGIEVTTPAIEITEAQIDSQIERMRKIRGRFEPLTDTAAGVDDLAVADVTLSVGGVEVKSEENVQVGIRPQRLDGIALETLGDVLTGVKPGETRTVECTIPDDYERADLRGKTGMFAFAVQELKRLRPVEVGELATQHGCDSADQLRQFVRDDIEAEKDETLERARAREDLRLPDREVPARPAREAFGAADGPSGGAAGARVAADGYARQRRRRAHRRVADVGQGAGGAGFAAEFHSREGRRGAGRGGDRRGGQHADRRDRSPLWPAFRPGARRVAGRRLAEPIGRADPPGQVHRPPAGKGERLDRSGG